MTDNDDLFGGADVSITASSDFHDAPFIVCLISFKTIYQVQTTVYLKASSY